MADVWDPFADPADLIETAADLIETAAPKLDLVEQGADKPEAKTSNTVESHTHSDEQLEEASFEYLETRFGPVGALIHRGTPTASFDYAVVLVPGNPGVSECEVGKFHSHTPGLSAIASALRTNGVPFLQFDFTGVGLSAKDGPFKGDWVAYGADDPEFLYQDRGIADVVAWAREHLHDRIVLCCWNWSGWAAQNLVTSNSLYGYVSVSMPYNILMVAQMRGDQHSHDRMKAIYEHFIPNVDCKSLYVCGNQDAMCPVHHIRRLNKKRKEGDVMIYEVNQKGEGRSSDDNFNMVGHEEEVAGVLVNWMKNLTAAKTAVGT